jgi:hypothetical protein
VRGGAAAAERALEREQLGQVERARVGGRAVGEAAACEVGQQRVDLLERERAREREVVAVREGRRRGREAARGEGPA